MEHEKLLTKLDLFIRVKWFTVKIIIQLLMKE